MKKYHIILGMFCLLAGTACSDDDPVVKGNNGNQTERKIFAAHSRRNAGIGKIGAAYYLCGKISPREVARQQQNDNK